jgi:hypothetical protein
MRRETEGQDQEEKAEKKMMRDQEPHNNNKQLSPHSHSHKTKVLGRPELNSPNATCFLIIRTYFCWHPPSNLFENTKTAGEQKFDFDLRGPTHNQNFEEHSKKMVVMF